MSNEETGPLARAQEPSLVKQAEGLPYPPTRQDILGNSARTSSTRFIQFVCD